MPPTEVDKKTIKRHSIPLTLGQLNRLHTEWMRLLPGRDLEGLEPVVVTSDGKNIIYWRATLVRCDCSAATLVYLWLLDDRWVVGWDPKQLPHI